MVANHFLTGLGFGLSLSIAALVLFDLLARFDDTDRFESEDAAETWAMALLHGALERVLVEPFHPDYVLLVQAARARIEQPTGVE